MAPCQLEYRNLHWANNGEGKGNSFPLLACPHSRTPRKPNTIVELLQVALAVGVAEEACQFEHRDLHWGNLLIRRGAPATASYRFRCDAIPCLYTVDRPVLARLHALHETHSVSLGCRNR